MFTFARRTESGLQARPPIFKFLASFLLAFYSCDEWLLTFFDSAKVNALL
jgi:hypothetical protein